MGYFLALPMAKSQKDRIKYMKLEPSTKLKTYSSKSIKTKIKPTRSHLK